MIFFRLPFSKKIFTTNENSENSPVVFTSFDEKNKIDFKGNLIEISKENLPQKLSSELGTIVVEFSEEQENSYTEKLEEVIEFIKENDLKKLVISRQKLLVYSHLNDEAKINLTQTFFNISETYPNALSYFINQNGECWIGAFSEVLGKFNKRTSEFETMSLAGTLPVDEVWTSKELEEQKPVSDYIQNILKNYSENIEISETKDHISGNIKHLRTDFKAKINPKNLDKIISELHPTPAVCGIPKEFCKDAIKRFENYPREFYAGHIRIETEDFIQYFVNLRCAKFYENCAKIFVGGGITRDSDPQKEWRETELKSEAILKNISLKEK